MTRFIIDRRWCLNPLYGVTICKIHQGFRTETYSTISDTTLTLNCKLEIRGFQSTVLYKSTVQKTIFVTFVIDFKVEF